jgi:tetratricopeptide (TPR) repeat protein
MQPLIQSFAFDPRREPGEYRKRLLAAPVSDVDMKAREYYFLLVKVDPEAAKQWYQRANHGHGLLYPELAQQARGFPEGYVQELRPLTRFLVQSSPHAPVAQAFTAIYGGPEVVARLPGMETRYAGHAIVQWGIGQRHLADKRIADAVRCWKRWVELSPSGEAFRKLAGVYLANGEEDRWRDTLEACLKEEDVGLFHAEVRVDLARHYMAKKDFKRAEPYAIAATQSGAEWAYLCAAECQEGLGRWDVANKLYETSTDRYGQSAYAWYFACRATGKMDRVAAEGAVRGYIAQFGPGTSGGELVRAGRVYLLAGELKEARALFDRANQIEATDLSLLFAALMADASGDSKGRKAALDQFDKLPDDKNVLRPIGGAIREWSEAGTVPDNATVEAAIGKFTRTHRADGEYYFGWYLHNRKQIEQAVTLWKHCLEAETGTLLLKTHARALVESASRKKD